jgi:UDPglucose 6-dehydrogenase
LIREQDPDLIGLPLSPVLQLDLDNSKWPQSLRELTPVSDPVAPTIKNICVIGAGYVGGPTAAIIALHNPSIRVEVVDKDPRRIRQWNSPHLPIHEPGLNDLVRVARDGARTMRRTSHDPATKPEAIRAPNLIFTLDAHSSIAKADLIFLAVNTPTKTLGHGAGRATNMASFDAAANEVARFARPGTIVVEKSTVPCGTAKRIRHMVETLRPGISIEVLSNPEFLAEGSAVENLLRPDRVIIGSARTTAGRQAAAALASVYATWVPKSRILHVNAWSSELAKLVSNAMLAQRISSINSISAICDRTGADVDEIARAVGRDPRIGPHFLKAGLGYGGSCFRKDIASLTYLAESLGLPEVADYWNQVNVMNELQRRRFARKVVQRLGDSLDGKKIALLGFAFKKDTGDTRESVAVDVIQTLLDEGPVEIAIFDPCCREEDILREIDGLVPTPGSSPSSPPTVMRVYADPYQACEQASAVLVITESDQFRNSSHRINGNGAQRRTAAEPTTAKSKLSIFNPINRLSHAMTSSRAAHPSTRSSPSSEVEDEEQLVKVSSTLSFRLCPLPRCADDCAECQSLLSRSTVSSEPVEWARIAYSMQEPRWAFDGRGVLDVDEMEKLGFRVDTLGRGRTEGEEEQTMMLNH